MPEAGKYGIVYADPPWRYDRNAATGWRKTITLP